MTTAQSQLRNWLWLGILMIIGLILFSGCNPLSQVTLESTPAPVESAAEVSAAPTEISREPTAVNDGD